MSQKRRIVTTSDGSSSLYLEEWDEHYHSHHGALAEARHVFIRHGLQFVMETKEPSSVALLEIGFGTGLNALLSALFAQQNLLTINYTGVEAFPVRREEWQSLNYPELLQKEGDSASLFENLHESSWSQPNTITPVFILEKRNQDFRDICDERQFDLIYFDAFGARVQPELWERPVFDRMYKALKPGGILVTYASKGSVRRAMQASGFTVEKLPGPPGKREMVRAWVPD